MADLGCKRHMIHSVGSIAETQEIIKTKKIGVVLSEYKISGGSGFDLFKMLKADPNRNPKLCLILVTSNISQTAVAKAAEEDVDSFITKPYTLQSIKENLVLSIAEKIQPSRYTLKVEEAKKFIFSSNYEEALKLLRVAMKMHPTPSLALFYIGQTEYLQQLKEQAQNSYQKGLELNEIHFKCLVGLYDLFMQDKKFREAYSVIKRLATFFPANPERLKQSIHLAVRTENFPDMNLYYDLFTNLDDRDPGVVNYIGAGLYVAGKNSIMNSDLTSAMIFFDKMIVSCGEMTKLIKGTIFALIEHNLVDEAESFLRKFPPDRKSSSDYLVSDYLVTSNKFSDPNLVIKEGLGLYNQNIRDLHCLKIMIEAMGKSGYSTAKLQPFQEEVRKLQTG